jgi:hypothetical protein
MTAAEPPERAGRRPRPASEGMADDATIAQLASLSPEERQILLKVSEIL